MNRELMVGIWSRPYGNEQWFFETDRDEHVLERDGDPALVDLEILKLILTSIYAVLPWRFTPRTEVHSLLRQVKQD